jgi:transcriptional regulator
MHTAQQIEMLILRNSKEPKSAVKTICDTQQLQLKLKRNIISVVEQRAFERMYGADNCFSV